MIPGTALIATVFQESSGIRRWLDALAAQTECPEEFVIVDGGSKDDTVAQIEGYVWTGSFPKPRVIVERCNIATGRNIAVRNCTAPIIVATDAGSLAHPQWFDKMTRPFAQDAGVSVVAGHSDYILRNAFQKRLSRYLGEDPPTSETVMPSSRCIAFRRTAWATVGGYPEWLTLTAEDTLFNYNLRAAGLRFCYQPAAIISWEVRPDLQSYLRMMYHYGFGWAEARLPPRIYLRYLISVIIVPVIFLSRNPLRDIPLRYLRNLAGSAGWLMGLAFGHQAPSGWKKIDGFMLSPESLRAAGQPPLDPPAK